MAAAIALRQVARRSPQEAFRFGLAMPLTGAQALYGQDQVKAAEWAVADINETGRRQRQEARDDHARHARGSAGRHPGGQPACSRREGPGLRDRLERRGQSVAPIANDNKVVELCVGANSPDIAKLGDYVYTTFPLADIDITAVAKYAVKELGKKKAAVLYINNETGSVAAEVYREVFTEAGGQVVAYEAYDPKATDLTGPLLKVRAANPGHHPYPGLVADTPAGHRADAPARPAAADHLLFGDL